jgi:alpha-amylase
MTTVCLYFQVHQPKRLRKYTIFDIDHQHFYHDDEKNRSILLKVADKCYLPTNELFYKLIKKYERNFKISYSISGLAIEQFKSYCPEVLDSFKKLADSGCVEFLNETYHHSLSFLYSKDTFLEEVALHKELIKKEFGQNPKTFRNTELICNNELAQIVEKLGYTTMLAEGADKILEWRSPNYLYQPTGCNVLKLLLRNYSLSDDIAFRFSNKHWAEHPLTADKFAHWVHNISGENQTVNLFMDYETFGEHQWSETGIFQFLEHLPESIFKNPNFSFATPSEVAEKLTVISSLDMPHLFSWADIDRDLTAWRGNDLQEDALQTVFSLEKMIRQLQDPALQKTWLSLLTSDHFYYMCTKWNADGDVHKYFNPYQSPYDAYINYQNIMADFTSTLQERLKEKKKLKPVKGKI